VAIEDVAATVVIAEAAVEADAEPEPEPEADGLVTLVVEVEAVAVEEVLERRVVVVASNPLRFSRKVSQRYILTAH
jgi:hypothetical protein